MLVVLILAAAGAMWVVMPRVQHRARLLEAQDAVLAGRGRPAGEAWVADTTWIASRPGMMMPDRKNDVPQLRTFVAWSLGSARAQAAFFGGRDAGAGERLVLVWGDPTIHGSSRPPEISFNVYVLQPGGWFRKPELLNQSAVGPIALPVGGDAGWRLAVLWGRADPADPTRFLIDLEAGYDGHAAERRMTVVGHLLPDDTVRWDWPTDSTPANPQTGTAEGVE